MKFKKILAVSASALLLFGVAACGGNNGGNKPSTSQTQQSGVEAAKDYLFQLYKGTKSVKGDTKFVNSVEVGGVTYSVAWELTVQAGGVADAVKLEDTDASDKFVNLIVKYDSNNAVETKFTLKATISDGKESAVQEFEMTVPAFTYTSLKEFLEAATGADVNVKGRITMVAAWKSSYTTINVWIQNDEAGYYGYKLPCADQETADKLKVGNEIIISGTKDVYNGQLEIASQSFVLVSDVVSVAPYVDATAAFTAAASGKDTASLNKYQNMKVELKGVEVTTVTEQSSGNYYNFHIGNADMYLRASTTYGLTADNYTAMFADWKTGYKADVKGVVVVYSNQFYLQPIDADAVTYTSTTLTDDQVAAGAIEAAKALFAETYTENASVTLPATFGEDNSGSYTWSLAEGSEGVAIADGKATITIGEALQTGKVSVKAVKGDAEKTATIEFAIQPLSVSTIADALAKEDKTVVKVAGKVMACSTRGYVLADSTGMVYVYAYNGEKVYYEVGKSVEIVGELGTYNGRQIVPTKSVEVEAITVTEPEATNIDAAGLETYLESQKDIRKVTVTGTLAISGNYYNITVDGVTTGHQASLSYVTDAQKTMVADLAGKAATYTGYAFGYSTKKVDGEAVPYYLNMIVTNAVAA